MGVGAGLSMYVVVVQKFTFAISSPDEFLSNLVLYLHFKYFLHVFGILYFQKSKYFLKILLKEKVIEYDHLGYFG